MFHTDRFGMYSYKDKGSPQSIVVFEPLSGKHMTVNIDELANKCVLLFIRR